MESLDFINSTNSLKELSEFDNKLREDLKVNEVGNTKKELKKLKNDISNGIINQLNSNDGYKVKDGDVLSIINKITSQGNHIDFNNKGDKIWPGDIITIKNRVVYREHNGEKVEVGVVVKGFVSNEITNPAPADAPATAPADTPAAAPADAPATATVATPAAVAAVDVASADEVIEDHIETLESLSDYFNNQNLDKLDKQIKENGLRLNINQFLSKYKNYIETNLVNFKYKNKIILSISNKINSLSELIDERIAWVDEQIIEGDYTKEDRTKEIQNQRWIINSKLNDLFSEVNNEILPSAVILYEQIKTSDLEKDLELEKMFEAEILEDGDFDKTIWSGEMYDAATNSWSVIDSTDDKHKKFLKDNNIETIEEISLLNEKDNDIETKAQMMWFAFIAALVLNDLATFTGVWTVPGAVIGAGYDGVDMFTDEDHGLLILKSLGLVNKDYRMEKSWIDNTFAAIGIIPGATAVIKSGKIAEYVKKLSPKKLKMFNESKEKIISVMKSKFSKNAGKNYDTTGEILEGATSNPIEFYKNPKTGATYTKTLDGKYFNSKGIELKRKPKNIEKVGNKPETIIKRTPEQEQLIQKRWSIRNKKRALQIETNNYQKQIESINDKIEQLGKKKIDFSPNKEYKKLVKERNNASIGLKNLGDYDEIGIEFAEEYGVIATTKKGELLDEILTSKMEEIKKIELQKANAKNQRLIDIEKGKIIQIKKELKLINDDIKKFDLELEKLKTQKSNTTSKKPEIKNKETVTKVDESSTRLNDNSIKNLIENNLNKLTEGSEINIGKYNIKKEGSVFKMTKDGKTETYSNLSILVKELKITKLEKIDFILKQGNSKLIEEINNSLKKKNIELISDGNGLSIFKKGKKIEFEKLGESEQNLILRKAFPGAKIENLQNLFNNSGFDNLASNFGNKLKGKSKNGFDNIIKQAKKQSTNGKEFMKSLLWTKGFGNNGPLFTKGKLGWTVSLASTGYFSQEEISSIYSSFIDEDKDVLSLENGGNIATILINLWAFKNLGLIRTVIYDFIFEKLMNWINKLNEVSN